MDLSSSDEAGDDSFLDSLIRRPRKNVRPKKRGARPKISKSKPLDRTENFAQVPDYNKILKHQLHVEPEHKTLARYRPLADLNQPHCSPQTTPLHTQLAHQPLLPRQSRNSSDRRSAHSEPSNFQQGVELSFNGATNALEGNSLEQHKETAETRRAPTDQPAETRLTEPLVGPDHSPASSRLSNLSGISSVAHESTVDDTHPTVDTSAGHDFNSSSHLKSNSQETSEEEEDDDEEDEKEEDEKEEDEKEEEEKEEERNAADSWTPVGTEKIPARLAPVNLRLDQFVGLSTIDEESFIDSTRFESTPVEPRRRRCEARHQSVGAHHQSVGAHHQSVGAHHQSAEARQQSVGARHSSSWLAVSNRSSIHRRLSRLSKTTLSSELDCSAASELPLEEQEAAAKRQVVSRCGGRIVPFSQLVGDGDVVEKIGEGAFGEVFRVASGQGGVAIWKVIPVGSSTVINNENQKSFVELLPEVVVSQTMSQVAGFVRLARCALAIGRYPSLLLAAWDAFDGTDNERPDKFDNDQVFVVFEMEAAGESLEDVGVGPNTHWNYLVAKQLGSVFAQLALALAVAEQTCRFEHRDLHWGNVLLRPSSADFRREFRVGDKSFLVPSNGVLVTIIDFTLSRLESAGQLYYLDLNRDEEVFNGDAELDIQFDVYRDMRSEVDGDWARYSPLTNVFWLRYLARKLVNEKAVRKAKLVDLLKNLAVRLSDFKSAAQLVGSKSFAALVSLL